jgi:regulator of replication initiation timing
VPHHRVYTKETKQTKKEKSSVQGCSGIGTKKQKIKIDFFKYIFIFCSFIKMAQLNPESKYIEDIDELARVIGRLDDKTRELLVENTILRRNNEELKMQNEKLTSEIVEDLKSEIEYLKSENEELTSENEELKKQLAEFKCRCSCENWC